MWINNPDCSAMFYCTVTADLFRYIEQAQQGQVKVSSASRPNRLEFGKSLHTGKQLCKATSETVGTIVMTIMIFQFNTEATILCTNGILVYITMHPTNPNSDLRTDVWKKGGNDDFPASISPPGVIKPGDNTSIAQRDTCQQTDEVNEEDTNGRHNNHQAFINMQSNIVQCRMNRGRDQIFTPVSDKKMYFWTFMGKKQQANLKRRIWQLRDCVSFSIRKFNWLEFFPRY
jgi:hypothetical protein